MIGVAILAVSGVMLLIGIFVVLWQWSVQSNPDAPVGGKIVLVAFAGLACGSVIAIGKTIRDVQELKQHIAMPVQNP